MPRGSKPGERRGGRQRTTPNRRTVLTNRILADAADNPASTVNELVLVLAKDQGLPADIRIAVTRKASLFGSSRSKYSRSVAPNGHGSKPETKTGPDRDEGGGAIAAKGGLATDLLFAIARDTAAKAADRRKAASYAAAAQNRSPRREPALAKHTSRDQRVDAHCATDLNPVRRWDFQLSSPGKPCLRAACGQKSAGWKIPVHSPFSGLQRNKTHV
jgi:hypothetical protein